MKGKKRKGVVGLLYHRLMMGWIVKDVKSTAFIHMLQQKRAAIAAPC